MAGGVPAALFRRRLFDGEPIPLFKKDRGTMQTALPILRLTARIYEKTIIVRVTHDLTLGKIRHGQ